jgi:hypothetical protein
MRTILPLVAGLAFAALASQAMAQVPVIDNANLQKAQEIATSTQKILSADQQIMQFTQKTLQAVTGDRSSQAQGTLAQTALGSGSRWRRPRRSGP